MSAIKSNCSENISDRDELTNTEQRKNDGATEQQIDTVTENRNRGKKTIWGSPKAGVIVQKTKMWSISRQRTRRVRNSWLACFLRKQTFEEIVQDKKLKDSILKENPVPTNITKPRKLDKYYKELLEKYPAKREKALYGTLEKK